MKGVSYAKLRRLCEPAASLRPRASNKHSRTTAAANTTLNGSWASCPLMLSPFVVQVESVCCAGNEQSRRALPGAPGAGSQVDGVTNRLNIL